MKSIAIIFTSLFVLFLFGSNPLVAQCDGTFRFVNNTGREVTDLHIEFEEAGAKLVSHNFPGRPSTPKANYEGPNTNGTQKRWDIIKGKLPNKGVATLTFKSEDCRLRISRWWWTVDDNPATTPYGDRKPGTTASGASRDRDLIAPGETVTKVPLTQPYTKKRNGKNTRIGINDLHIVSRKRPTVLNKTRKSENGTAKAGGVFENESVTTCDCDAPQPDKPCKQVCKGQTGTLYVLNLVTAEELKLGQKVDLELKGVTEDDLKWLWWTKDGRPYTGTWDDPDRGSKGEGVSQEDGDSVSGKPKEDWNEVVGNFILPGNPDSRSALALGVFGGVASSPFQASVDFGPGATSSIMNAIYGNPDVMAQFLEGLGGEFFLGDFTGETRMILESQPATAQFGAHFRLGLTDQLSVDARGAYSTANAMGRFPVTVFPWETESTEEFYEAKGTYQVERTVQEVSIGANYLFGTGSLRAGFGGYAAAQRIKTRSNVFISGQSLELSDAADFALSAQLRGIVQYQPFDRVFLEGGVVRSLHLSGVPAGDVTAFQLGIGFFLGR